MTRMTWLGSFVAILAGCSGQGSAKPYRPQSPPEFRTAAASIMGKDVNNSVSDDPDNLNPRIRLQPSPGKAPLIGNRPVEVLASNNKSGAYVAFTGQVPVTQFFRIIGRADCDDWVYLQPITPFEDYYKSGDYTGDKPALQCLGKVHQRYRNKSDERLAGSDGVVFDALSAKYIDRDDSAYGPRKIHMDGWAIKFVEPTSADIAARLDTKPLSPIDIVQFKTAAYWVEKHRVAAFAPALRKLLPLELSFSEDDCTNQRDMKPAVHTAPDSPISGLLCTKLVYAQYSCAPKRGEHGDRYRTDCRARRSHPVRTGMGACSLPRGDHWAVGAVGDGRA
jgi:hypothetical protein